MKVFIAIIPLLLSVGSFANPTFRFDDGIEDSRCPLNENPMNPVHLPHARDCGKFLKCFKGRAFTIDCPPGQEFGPQIQRCDYPAYAQCRSVLALPEPAEFHFEDGISDVRCARNDDPMHPLHLPHPTNCQKFMKCFSGMRFELDCPPGQHWAAHLNRCDFPSIAKCKAKPFQADGVNTAEDSESVKESPENTAVESEEAVETAINDLPFALPAIVLPMKAEFVYNAGVPDIRCPRTDDPFRPIHLPHSTDCGRFQKCFDGRAYILNCPPGQEFGPKINRCDYPQYAQCSLPKRKNLSKRLGKAAQYDDYYDYYSDEEFPLESSEWTEEQREMVAGIEDSRCPRSDDNEHPTHLTHKKDCEKFYKCYDGRAYLIQCPAGQHWSVRYDRCDYPKVAKCTIRP